MKIRFVAVAVLGLLAALAFAGDSAEEMLSKVKAVKMPTYDAAKGKDKGYIDQYYSEIETAYDEKCKLILEFYKAYPDNEEAEKLMNQRWGMMSGVRSAPSGAKLKGILTDIDGILASNPAAKVKQDGTYWKSYFGLMDAGADIAKANASADAFINAYPKDPRSAQLLQSEAEMVKDKAARRAIYERLAKDYKETISGKYAPGIIRQMDAVGKPFELSFTDATTGKKVSTADLKGKVVLVDFWATWCGPCVAKMPEMKQMYADLHSKGLEVLGVSLDNPEAQGGLTKLKDYVAKNQVAWPQFYQGNGWNSDFSTSWGINSIPCVFLIDKNGNLAEITYPEGLEAKIKKLLGN
jgi:thiol-disulfide isomerase/thioredoxin